MPSASISLQALEESLVRLALMQTGNDQPKAARLLCLSRDQLHYRVDRYGLS